MALLEPIADDPQSAAGAMGLARGGAAASLGSRSDMELNPVSPDLTGANIGVAPDRTIPANSNVGKVPAEGLREAVKQRWIEAGATPEAAEGIAQRIDVESKFNPLAVGDKGTSFGLYQHHADRAKRLNEFASAQGKSPADPLVQTDFAIHEMKGGDPIAAKNAQAVLSATDPKAAYGLFTASFERPATNLRGWATGISPGLQAQGEELKREADSLRDQYHADAAELMRQANTAPAGSKDRDGAIAQLREKEHAYLAKYEEISNHPPAMKPVDAFQNFGSAATIIALLGGLFSRRHITTALSAAGDAMKAINQNNYEDFQRHYKVWEQQTTTALNMVKLHNEEIRSLIDDKKMAWDEKNTRLSQMFQALGMTRQADMMALGAHERVFQEQAGLERALHSAAQAQKSVQIAGYSADVNGGMAPHEAAKKWGLVPPSAGKVDAKSEAAEAFKARKLSETGKPPTYEDWVKFSQDTKGAATGQLSPEAVKLLAQQYEMGDPGVITSLPRGGPARIQVENQVAEDLRGLDDGAKSIVMNRLRMAEARSAATTAGRITMQTDLYVNEAIGAGKLVVDASKLFPRTNFPKVNAALQAYATNTGDPNIIKFGTALNALINVYGKMSNPTGTGIHDADKERLVNILDTRLSQGQIEAGVEQVIAEGRNVAASALKAQEEVLQHLAPQVPGASPSPSGAAPMAPAGQTGVPVPAGHANDPDGTRYGGSDGKTYVKRGPQMVPE